MLNVLLPFALAVAVTTAANNTPNALTITAVPSTFTPAKITIQRGVTTRLVFQKTEGLHAIESTDLGIPKTVLSPDKDVTIDVTPAKDGTFVLHCEVVCGPDHNTMTLTVTVEG
jgi:heme/copper-type cytochrome/quinol oxidase subunit 2